MWISVLDRALAQLFQTGAIEIAFPDGACRRYGPAEDCALRVRICDASLPRRLCLDPELALGEGYMSGGIRIEQGSLEDLLNLAIANRRAGHAPALFRRAGRLAGWLQRNVERIGARRSRRNVHHHYDLSRALYDLFLDADRQYSCAYFADPAWSLDRAQAAKKDHIARKLCLAPGMRVLDIGCGWGGLAISLARDHGVSVTGITLSDEQYALARDRVAAAGLSGRIDIRLQDYRAVEGPFDRLVSVGMFEHVGARQFGTYFEAVRRLLTEDGIALIHTIGQVGPPTGSNSWIRKYIFPGGYLPSLGEAGTAIDRTGLVVADVETWRLHYARTLEAWLARFRARSDAAEAIYDARFVRMWEFYLAAAAAVFRHGRLLVYQFQLSRSLDAVPVTRDYLYTDGSREISNRQSGAPIAQQAVS